MKMHTGAARVVAVVGISGALALGTAAPSGAAKGLPKGQYPCYAMISGFLNYMFFDFVYSGGNSYGTVQAQGKRKVRKNGVMKIASNGSIRFTTGPLKGYYGALLKPGPGIGLSSKPTTFFNTTCRPKS